VSLKSYSKINLKRKYFINSLGNKIVGT